MAVGSDSGSSLELVTVEVCGQATFSVQLGSSASPVFQRYSDFRALDRELRRARRMPQHGSWERFLWRRSADRADRSLPALPPRSEIRKRLCPKQFMERRREGLRTYLAAVMADSEHLDIPALREFVGLDSATAREELDEKLNSSTGSSSTLAESSSISTISLQDRCLYTIEEDFGEGLSTTV